MRLCVCQTNSKYAASGLKGHIEFWYKPTNRNIYINGKIIKLQSPINQKLAYSLNKIKDVVIFFCPVETISRPWAQGTGDTAHTTRLTWSHSASLTLYRAVALNIEGLQ